ncbi:helix-turn-helix transcriptional regulator [Microlunatus speluncae]|uniref:helix-turn-helix transcriptional regulator n=1 Tax=Microlunatus speluncae TaxID=2594267 RepID=UPI001266166F|nr:helix-turn-helix transcriptional regulator [Microlunatus speluncae]
MTTGAERRRELGAFLRKRREQIVRADYALPPVGRGRELGLRREEVAYLSGVSVTWYTWLEQGRDINPSRQVLDAVAVQLRLTGPEHEYVLTLAGLAPLPAAEAAAPTPAPPHLHRLIDAQLPSPAFAITPDWGIAAWNRAYEILYPAIGRVDPADRNLLLLIFTDPYVRRMLPDWEITSRRFLAEYRAEAGPLLGQPSQLALIDRLTSQSPDFARAWEEHQVDRFSSRERRFEHPEAGELIFEQHRLIPSDLPGLHLVIYLPHPTAVARLVSLLERAGRGDLP